MLNAFTVDVEDYFQVSAFDGYISRDDWESFESRVVANTTRILDLLREHKVNATFFVLGWVADKFPDLVSTIVANGHEVGSHSYWHRLVYDLDEEEFRGDLRRSRQALERIVNGRIRLFRAPSFSITRRSEWALDVLIDEGFQVDSSIFPVVHDRYGMPGGRPEIHRINRANGSIVEFPMCYRSLLGYRLPVSGGGYFRLYPYYWTRNCFRYLNHKTQRPFVFYIHPWEVDTQQPRLKIASRATRFRHYVNIRKTTRKLEKLLRHFQFGRMTDVIDQHLC